MTVRITILRGPSVGQSQDFDEDEITLGSGRTNSMVIRDNDVSTTHCRISSNNTISDYTIEDLGSQYGTYVNGQSIKTPWRLKSGSIIELGSQVTLEYRVVDPDDDIESGPLFIHAGDPGTQPCLVLVENAHIQAAYLLQSREITIGRSIGNDIVIQKTDISREHVRLVWQQGGYTIEDMKSRNGTFVNSVGVTQPIALNHSDIIRLGSATQLHYVYRSDLPEEWDPINSQIDSKPMAISSEDMTSLPIRGLRREGTREIRLEMQPGELENHILIVYDREDWEAIVATIMLNLNDSRHMAWVDQHLRPDSDTWRQSIEQAQLECWLLIVVVSPEALQSDYVKEQYRYFYNREKPIIVVDYKEVDRLPIQLSRVARVHYEPDKPGKMMQQLVSEIQRLKPRTNRDGDDPPTSQTGYRSGR